MADCRPDLLRSLVVLSHPHPAAFGRASALDADGQRRRSRNHRAFDDPETATKLLENDARRLRMLRNEGVPEEEVDYYMSVLGEHNALESALAWYRATSGMDLAVIGAIDAPTTLS